jgi:tetratricopeptide (TPR) repeat protein
MAESAFARQRREFAAYRRSLASLVLGLPAVAAALACLLGLTFAGRQQHAGDHRARYLAAAHAALKNEDWSSVEMYARKLVDLRPDDPVGKYYLALCADADEDTSRARRLMKQIAPPDRPGFAPAQWWLVCDLTRDGRTLSIEQAEQVRRHLLQYLAAQERDAAARMLLGQVELALGNLDEALRQMKRAADVDPAGSLIAARVGARFGRSGYSRAHADQACRWLAIQVHNRPHDVEARGQWAEALAMTGRFSQAASVLIEGLAHDDDPRLRAQLVRLAVASFDVIARRQVRTPADFQQQLALINRTLPLAPAHEPLLVRLIRLSADPFDLDRQAAAMLQQQIASAGLPTSVLRRMGQEAVRQQDFALAGECLQAVVARQPDSAVDLNNLAWVLAQHEQEHLPRALQLVEGAIAAVPERAEFRETRGQILARMQRYEEAIAELKRGLDSPGAFTQTNAVLADAYDAIGQTQLADYHRTQPEDR